MLLLLLLSLLLLLLFFFFFFWQFVGAENFQAGMAIKKKLNWIKELKEKLGIFKIASAIETLDLFNTPLYLVIVIIIIIIFIIIIVFIIIIIIIIIVIINTIIINLKNPRKK